MLIIKLYKDVNKLDNITAKDWIIKNSNIRVWNNLFKQLLISKFGNNCDKISATWFVDMVRIRSNRGLRGEKLGYIKGGFQYFIESLVSRMEEFNVTILKNIKIKKIKLKNKKVEFIVTRDKEIFADNFISTIPINSLINYFNLQKNYKNEFKELNYQGAICVLLGLKKNLTNNFYWVNIIDEKSPFGAYIEHTNFVRDGYRDCNIVYLASYPDYEKKIWKMNDKDIFKLYFNYLKSMFNKLHYKDVIWWKVSKGKYAGLVYKKGILSYLPNFKFLDNLYIGGLFNARHSGLDEAVKIGHTLANFVLK